MKKMTWDEWKAHEQSKRAQEKDPKRTVKFEYDKENGEMVHCGDVDQVKH